ncbi:hypothetical protein [Microbacterium sp. GXF7504]
MSDADLPEGVIDADPAGGWEDGATADQETAEQDAAATDSPDLVTSDEVTSDEPSKGADPDLAPGEDR